MPRARSQLRVAAPVTNEELRKLNSSLFAPIETACRKTGKKAAKE